MIMCSLLALRQVEKLLMDGFVDLGGQTVAMMRVCQRRSRRVKCLVEKLGKYLLFYSLCTYEALI